MVSCRLCNCVGCCVCVQLSGVRMEDAGEYSVFARNIVGSVSTSAVLTVSQGR